MLFLVIVLLLVVIETWLTYTVHLITYIRIDIISN